VQQGAACRRQFFFEAVPHIFVTIGNQDNRFSSHGSIGIEHFCGGNVDLLQRREESEVQRQVTFVA
jgi:hypothetical protein